MIKTLFRLSNIALLSTGALLFSGQASADVCQLESLATDAYKEAMYFYPCEGNEALPAITLTAGYSNTYRNLQWMAEALADHGYLVLALTPTDIYGKVEQWRDAHLAGQQTLKDAKADSKLPFANRIDVDRRGIAGFSMGGGGTLLAGSELGDDIQALAAFAPFLLAEQRRVTPTAPTMILAGARDLLVTNESIDEIYKSVSTSAPQRVLAVYENGRHQQWYRPEITKNRDSYTEHTLAWFDLQLKGVTSQQAVFDSQPGDAFTRYEVTLAASGQ